jgi:S-disulfanyl-L-cysteine oxidoreductase SoxD
MSSFRNASTVTWRWPRKARPSKGGCGPSFEARRKRGERFRMTLCIWLGMAVSTSLALAAEPGHFGYGRLATPAEIAGWDIEVRGDDGAGLPAGQGAVAKGGEVYGEQCAACHGTFGEGEGRFPKLVGGRGTLTHDRPELTVGSYWPFAPTLWDYINRAMPMQAPHTLSADDVYALTAYILHLNDIVPGDFVADRNTLPMVKMPNRDSFVWTDPRPDTAATPCMTACADPDRVTITSTAEGKNLTPRTTGPLDSMQPK